MTAQEYEDFRNLMDNIISVRASIRSCDENIIKYSRHNDVETPMINKLILDYQERKKKYKSELAALLNGKSYEDFKKESIKISAVKSLLNQAIRRYDKHPDSEKAKRNLLVKQNNFERYKINL